MPPPSSFSRGRSTAAWATSRSVRRCGPDRWPRTRATGRSAKPLEDYLAGSLAGRGFAFALLVLFGAVTLVLAAIGIYEVFSYSVGRRTREIGIRIALSARRGDVLGAVLRQALLQIAAGVTLGWTRPGY